MMRKLVQMIVASNVLLATAAAADWTNAGGNTGRNGLSTELGPDAADLLWSGSRTSLIAWHPVIEGRRVFMVRQSGFPNQEPGKSPVVCHDLDTGAELWFADIPFFTNDWTTWVGGVRDGKVYASRGGNGASVSAKLYCLDAATGQILWESIDKIDAGAYDGMVFAPDGDPVIGSFEDIWRIDAADGRTVWNAKHTGSVSGTCGAALYGDAVYVVDAVGGGHKVIRFDLATGARMYESPRMDGFTIQNTPMCGPDGTIYVPRTQNNPSTDYFYAFSDDGFQMKLKWRVAAAWTTTSEFGVGPDGSVYTLVPGPRIARLDPDTGAELNTSAILSGVTGSRMAIDSAGRVFFSNEGFDIGRLYSFEPDLKERWSVAVKNINIGGPSLGADGTIVVCGVGTDVRAYRTPRGLLGDLNCDGVVDFGDVNPFVLALTDPVGYEALYPDCPFGNRDINGDGSFDFGDINPFVALLAG